MSDSAHLNGPSRPAVRLPATQKRDEPSDDQFDAPAALMRLLVGGVLVGAEELVVRLRAWEAATRATSQTTPQPMTRPSSAPRRYALIGMLFESEALARRGVSMMRSRLERLSYEAESYYDEMKLDASDMPQTPLDPVLAQLDDLLVAAQGTIDRWAARGRNEAEHASRMARLASGSVVDELLDYMARNPEVRRMVEQQATSTAEVAVDEVRGRTATADLWIEQLAHRVLRRPAGEAPRGDEEAVEAPHPAAETQATTPSNLPSNSPPTPGPTSKTQASHVSRSVEVPPNDSSDG